MIHRTAPTWQRIDAKIQAIDVDHAQNTSSSPRHSWQHALQHAITDPATLLAELELPSSLLPAAIEASKTFALRVPYTFLQRMEKGNPHDPLLKQVLPIDQELIPQLGYNQDPVGEQGNKHPGIIQKYQGRALLLVNGFCAVNCRYCFRRHFPYEDNRLSRQQWQQALLHLNKDTSINEVIFSGGDPLASSDKQLAWLTEQIAKIPHIQRLRIHTRLPVVIPARMTPESLQWMSNKRLSTVVVLHINHPNELNDPQLLQCLNTMKQAGITLLNQSVLLKGVNDNTDTLIMLSERLFKAGILPYYLHVLDKVAGAAHFDTSHKTAKQLHLAMTHQLSGYLVPKLVTEITGEPSKSPV